MKKYIILSIVFFLFEHCNVKNNDKMLQIVKFGSGYKIYFKESDPDSSNNTYSFFKRLQHFTEEQKISIIRELLSFEGDKRKSSELVIKYNKNLSQFYNGSTQFVTLEVIALFLINQVYFDNPFYYSPYAILVENETNQEIMDDHKKMNLVYKAYKNWFDLVLKVGWDESRELKLNPLNESEFGWIYGVNISPNQPLQFKVD